uniref:RNA-directed RNA polymerase n=1 Tax=Leviviridae sp. TaxID=2027243 RepID=A0A514D8T4_9VIRU|nr:MAG: RNA-dependent RNA polymerase [Leviviridae sp.]
MKSQVNALLHVMNGIFSDLRSAYPSMRGLGLDFEYLTLLTRSRGLGLYTLDLPNLDALLLEGLETGRLPICGPLSRVVSKGTKVPKFLSGLWLRVFDKDGCLRPGVDSLAILFLRQISCLGKKIVTECSYDRIAATIGEYHGIERQLRDPVVRWDSDDVDFENGADDRHLGESTAYSHSAYPSSLFSQGESPEERLVRRRENGRLEYLLDRVQQVADLIAEAIGPFDSLDLSGSRESEGRGSGLKHGPGAVAERLENHEKSDFPNWPHKLDNYFPFEFVGKTANSDVERPLNHEVASRLIQVPKTAKAPRLIAAEPTAHQYCQQLVWSFLRERTSALFKGYFVNFRRQDLSGEMVIRASLDRSLATVDLSSASDRLTCWTVERVFRRNPTLLHALHAVRTRYTRDNISDVPTFLRLKKFASQGSATTFPVQSIVFLTLALGVSIKGRIDWSSIWKLSNQVRVFGDDIILPSHGYAPLLAIMETLQLKVNTSKSYVTGFFRESCGSEAYLGDDVTPVKPKTVVAGSPAACQAIIDTSNNLFNKGFWNASDNLLHSLPLHIRRNTRIVDQHTAGFRGLTSYSGSYESHLRKRWNSRLHRHEVRVWSLQDQARKTDRGGFPALLDFLSSPHNTEHARIVSEYSGNRKTRGGFLWEPSNSDAHGAIGLSGLPGED